MTGPPAPPAPVGRGQLLAGTPPDRAADVAEVARAVARSGRRLVVLDDDPTGTQTVAGLPVLTRWAEDDLRWAFGRPAAAFFILTNSRSLAPEEMTRVNREVVAAVAAAAARAGGQEFVVASRSDSTLRGHYPAETDVLAAALRECTGRAPDGVVIVPAYLEAGRLTVDSVHWMQGPDGFIPVGHSEFARDPAFGYTSSDLRDYVAEKTGGRWAADQVARVTLADIRAGGPPRVAEILAGLAGGRPAVADAVTDDDLRLVVLGALEAEASGAALLYRAGPSFVRARAGLGAVLPVTVGELAALTRPAGRPGLVVVGSHVPRTTRQLEHLLALDGVARAELSVPAVLEAGTRDGAVAAAAAEVAAALGGGADVALCTSRELVTTAGQEGNLEIARAVSAALVGVVRAVTARARPAWIIGKGGITSSDLATQALGITRAWVRGPMLPGIISLWDPVPAGDGAAPVPFVVFAGNVGDDHALAQTVTRLRGRE